MTIRTLLAAFLLFVGCGAAPAADRALAPDFSTGDYALHHGGRVAWKIWIDPGFATQTTSDGRKFDEVIEQGGINLGAVCGARITRVDDRGKATVRYHLRSWDQVCAMSQRIGPVKPNRYYPRQCSVYVAYAPGVKDVYLGNVFKEGLPHKPEMMSSVCVERIAMHSFGAVFRLWWYGVTGKGTTPPKDAMACTNFSHPVTAATRWGYSHEELVDLQRAWGPPCWTRKK